MNTAVHFSSATDEWSTPQHFFDKLNEEFNFTLDACATVKNAKCFCFYSKDGGHPIPTLFRNWKGDAGDGAIWMNPPYGREIGKWVQKAATEAACGATVVALLPARTDTDWFHRLIKENPRAEVRFVKGRLKFGDSKNSAPFPSMVVVFR